MTSKMEIYIPCINIFVFLAFPVPQGIAGSGLQSLLGIEDETTNPLEVPNKAFEN